jgi:hypothetical protein
LVWRNFFSNIPESSYNDIKIKYENKQYDWWVLAKQGMENAARFMRLKSSENNEVNKIVLYLKPNVI